MPKYEHSSFSHMWGGGFSYQGELLVAEELSNWDNNKSKNAMHHICCALTSVSIWDLMTTLTIILVDSCNDSIAGMGGLDTLQFSSHVEYL